MAVSVNTLELVVGLVAKACRDSGRQPCRGQSDRTGESICARHGNRARPAVPWMAVMLRAEGERVKLGSRFTVTEFAPEELL